MSALTEETMPYEPNAVRWPPGSRVLHAADAKTPAMLMEVVGYKRDGSARTRYVNPPGPEWRGVLINRVERLLDPARFAVEVKQP